MFSSGALRAITRKPWILRKRDSPETRQANVDKWKSWWASAERSRPAPSLLQSVAPIHPERRDPAPPFELPDIDGRAINLAGQRGRITLLNFSGTWCPPCQIEIPDMVRIDAAYRSKGVDVVGIALSETGGASGLRKWCKAHSVAYRQALATDSILHAFGDIHEVPVSVLIDANGQIRRRWEGERDFSTFAGALDDVLTNGSLGNQRQTGASSRTMKLIFLTREGCVQTPKMRVNLDGALQLLKLKLRYEAVYISELPAADKRRGYGTPTLLVNERDLFGMPEPKAAAEPG